MSPQVALLLSFLWLQTIGKPSQPKTHLSVTSEHAVRVQQSTRITESNHENPPGDAPDFVRRIYHVPKNRGSRTLAVVIPYHYQNAENDLHVFSQKFDIKDCNMQSGCLTVLPSETNEANCRWGNEAALSLEWMHAMAPKAHLLLVEVKSTSEDDLFKAVRRAALAVIKAGGGEVVLPWYVCADKICVNPEIDDRYAKYDRFFIDGVVYFAASGDTKGGGIAVYPSTSSKVVSVGGTLPGDHPGTPNFLEKAWIHTRGGPSIFEPKPSFQKKVDHTPTDRRTTPDIAVSARSVAVYYTSPSTSTCDQGWQVYKGATSSATPIAAGIVNAAGRFYNSSRKELEHIYANRFDSTKIRDITRGGVSNNPATTGYDSISGVGALLGTDFDAPKKPEHR